MRTKSLAFLFSLIFFNLTHNVWAQNIMVITDAIELRSKANINKKPIATAPEGAIVSVEIESGEWTRVIFDNKMFYVLTNQLLNSSSRSMPTGLNDPSCDYAYPYSGSNIFFDRPLANLRHSEPLGFLFGYHRRAPC